MLLVNVEELRNWHAHFVGSPNEVRLPAREIILDAFRTLVKCDGFVDRVRNLGESLFVFVIDEFFLQDFHLVGLVNLSICDHNRLDKQWNDMAFHSVLLFVVDAHFHMRAVLDLTVSNLGECDPLVPADAPEVAQDQHSVYRDDHDEACRCKNVLFVEAARAKRIEQSEEDGTN